MALFIILMLFTLTPRCGKESSSCDQENRKDTIWQTDYAFRPGKTGGIPVSDKLMGFNVIYPHEKNSIWQDGKIAGCLKDVKVAFIRYPGGTVCSFYHWNSLTGEGWKDSWDPVNPVTPKDPSNFMDIDEYMALVIKTGATPLVGINMSSGWRWKRNEDSLREALDLMRYCKNKNFRVQYWYLDNEPYQPDSNGGSKTAEEYAALINTYVPAMKTVDPDIKIIANWNAGFKNKRTEYEKLIRLAGANIDVMDAHWYWAWNDASWTKWLSMTPMQQWTGFTYTEDIAYFRQMVKELGFPAIQLASLEWNSGPTDAASFTASQMALTQAEMMMQFISGGLDYAAFWPIQWPDEVSRIRSFYNTATNTVNPNYQLFQFLGKMQGGTSLSVQITKPGSNILSLVVRDGNLKTVRICILNKSTTNQVTDIQWDAFPGIKYMDGAVYTVNNNGSNFTLSQPVLLKSDKPEIIRLMSKAVSLTMLTFEEN